MTDKSRMEIATLGGGCFWCIEALYQRVQGVSKVVSGYAGGKVPKPTYQEVCSGVTGHAEVIQVHFDPSVITYEQILDIFWHVHDPTTLNRQGADVGTQYRSIILYHDEAQQHAALESLAKTDSTDLWDTAIVTEIAALETFYPAEDYHQNYYNENSSQGYCSLVIAPKLQKFMRDFPELLH